MSQMSNKLDEQQGLRRVRKDEMQQVRQRREEEKESSSIHYPLAAAAQRPRLGAATSLTLRGRTLRHRLLWTSACSVAAAEPEAGRADGGSSAIASQQLDAHAAAADGQRVRSVAAATARNL